MMNQVTYQQLGISEEMKDPCIRRIIDDVAPYSMVHETGIDFTIASVVYTIKNGLPGALVECGTWKGGCAVAMLLVQRELFGAITKPVYMLDSFEGLPRIDERDGPLAASWQAGAGKEKFFDNCRVAKEELQALLGRYRFEDSDYKIVRGWFDETIPALASAFDENGISVLRLDGDWYASTDVAVRHLVPKTCERGVVIVDDYYAWDGCARAVHDFLSLNDMSYRIKSLPYNFGAYFIKRAHRTSFDEF